MAQAKTIATKLRKKKWYPLIAPSMFRNAVLGETSVYDEAAIMGKTVTQNLMSLTGDVKKQNININFIVTKVENGKAFTDIIGYCMVPSTIRRLTRRKSRKIELSFAVDTADGKHIRVKPLIFPISSTKSSVSGHLLKTTLDFLTKTIKKMSYDDLVRDLISHTIQSSLRDAIKKIYPVRVAEIRMMYIVKEKRHEGAPGNASAAKEELEQKKEEAIEDEKAGAKKEVKNASKEKKEEMMEDAEQKEDNAELEVEQEIEV